MKTKGYVARMRRIIDPLKAKATHHGSDLLQLVVAVARHAQKNFEISAVDQCKRPVPVSTAVNLVGGQLALGPRNVLDGGQNIAGEVETGFGSVGLHGRSIREYGPYANRRDAHGGYFAVGGWEFHWFEDDSMKGPRPSWMKTRDDALQTAIKARDAMQAGNSPC